MGFHLTLNERIRLIGVDTPETRTRDSVEKANGLKAKEYLVSELKKCKNEVSIKVHGSGKYGRPLVEIYIGSINVNQLLVQNGHAAPYFGGKR